MVTAKQKQLVSIAWRCKRGKELSLVCLVKGDTSIRGSWGMFLTLVSTHLLVFSLFQKSLDRFKLQSIVIHMQDRVHVGKQMKPTGTGLTIVEKSLFLEVQRTHASLSLFGWEDLAIYGPQVNTFGENDPSLLCSHVVLYRKLLCCYVLTMCSKKGKYIPVVTPLTSLTSKASPSVPWSWTR